MSTFEGSYMGNAGRISDKAQMECKICWYVYDPEIGDETRQISAGTAFAALPHDWSCPECDADAHQFLVKHDPLSDETQIKNDIAHKTQSLVVDFREIYHAKMRDVPIINHALQVEAVGFSAIENGYIGVLIAPWFMNLILLPKLGDDWSLLKPTHKETIEFPSGHYEFIHNIRETIGGYKACSLFSPMGDFTSQLQAKEVAEAIMVELFNGENQAETDRSADIRKAHETPEEESEIEIKAETSRRGLLTGNFSEEVNL